MWMLQVFTLELRKFFAYRFDFWAGFFASLFSFGTVSYYLWKSIYEYQNVSVIGGYSFYGMLFYYFLAPSTEKFVYGLEHHGGMSIEIYDGSLSRFLMYPISFFIYKYITKLAFSVISLAQYLLVLLAYFILFHAPNEIALSLSGFALSISFSIFAGFVYYTMISILEVFAFWSDSIWSLMIMLRFTTSILGGALIPLSLFPKGLAHLVEYTPFPYFISLPVKLAMGQAYLADFLGGILYLSFWECIFLGLFYVVWTKGVREYSGVGI